MKHILFLSSLLALAACASPHLQAVCPTLVPYTPFDQAALASELRSHPDLRQTPRWLQDYIGLRDQVRACQEP